MEKLVVVIPAYNEEPTVGSTVRGVQETLATSPLSELQSEIIVIDDGSEDGTFREARETGALVLQHIINLGLGAALGTGFAAARLRDRFIHVEAPVPGLFPASEPPLPKHVVPHAIDGPLVRGYYSLFECGYRCQ